MTLPRNLVHPGWFTTAAEDAEIAQKARQVHARLNMIPEYRQHQQDTRVINIMLSELLYVDAHEFSVPSPGLPSKAEYRMARAEIGSKRPLTYDSDGYMTRDYKYFRQQREAFSAALQRYVSLFRKSEWDSYTYNRADAEDYLGRYTMDILRKGFKRASAPYDVGSSLYLYQQMYDRQLSESPALSRAAWLVKNAALRRPVPENPTPRGKWKLIQEQWKDHFDESHFWAAIVTITRSPLHFTEGLLFDFVCDVNVKKLNRIAYTFYDFRQRVVPSKISIKKTMYLKQGLAPYEIDQEKRLNPLEIPNLLEDFQWSALSRYPAKNRTSG